jgi:cytochrome bd-type quinol oxidase subunit 2
MTVYPWLVFVHIFGVLLFAFGHGTSSVVAFKVRGERERARIAALLEVSQVSTAVMYVGLVVLLAGGIAAGIAGQWFGQLWLWAAIVILVVTTFAMYAIASAYYGRLRGALGQMAYQPKGAPALQVSDAELIAMLRSRRPDALAAIGIIGLAAILWLMVFKPA